MTGSKVKFDGASLSHATLDSSILQGTTFASATLQYTSFHRTRMRGADLTGATLFYTSFVGVDLSEVVGLDRVIHYGPSAIDIDTIYRSKGKIPEAFLRSAGVPENFISIIPQLMATQNVEPPATCFISFSFKDQDFADRLHGRLRDTGLRVWYAPEDMRGGKKVHEQIEAAISVHDKLLVILSAASLASEWVKTEIRNALRQERISGKRKLFPIALCSFAEIRQWSCFDAEAGKDLGIEMREYYIPDFSSWKDHDKFEAEFKKLIRDLKADPDEKS